MFTRLCPAYMVMGMTYDEFWHCNTRVHKAYREAYDIRRHSEEWARHRLGAYFFNALMCAAPVMRASFGNGRVEPGKYPDQPWPLTMKEAREQEAERERIGYEKALAMRRAQSAAHMKKMKESKDEKQEADGNGRERDIEPVDTGIRER